MEALRRVKPFFYGALPHLTVDEAYEVLVRHQVPVIPWPQLPQRVFFERSVVQASWGFPGLVLDEPQRRQYVHKAHALAGLPAHTAAFLLHTVEPAAQWSPAEAAGLLAIVSGRVTTPAAVAYKGQLLGPISLAAQLTDEQQNPLLLDPTLFEGLIIHTSLRARLQAEALASVGNTVIVCLDEPFLELMQSPFMTLDHDELVFGLARVLDAIPCQRGLVVRCGVPLQALAQLPVDVLVLTHWDETTLSDSDFAALVDFVQRGGQIGLGIIGVPGSAQPTPAQQCAIMSRFLRAGITAPDLRAALWIAPQQSLGQSTTADAEATVAATCAAAAQIDAFLAESTADTAVSV